MALAQAEVEKAKIGGEVDLMEAQAKDDRERDKMEMDYLMKGLEMQAKAREMGRDVDLNQLMGFMTALRNAPRGPGGGPPQPQMQPGGPM
jgi:hypothetical protein